MCCFYSFGMEFTFLSNKNYPPLLFNTWTKLGDEHPNPTLKRCISKNTKDKIKCRDCHIIMTSPWHHPWHHHDIMGSHHMTSSMTSSWHLSLSILIHLTNVHTSVQRLMWTTHPMYFVYTYLLCLYIHTT